MLKLSPAERKYIVEGVEANLRSDGRSRQDFRYFTLETGVTVQTNGSARVKLDGTDVLVGVKVDIGEPLQDKLDQGRVEFSVEVCPSVSPELFEGRSADPINEEIVAILNRTYLDAFDYKTLCIVPGKMCWLIYVDVLVGNYFVGSTFGNQKFLGAGISR